MRKEPRPITKFTVPSTDCARVGGTHPDRLTLHGYFNRSDKDQLT